MQDISESEKDSSRQQEILTAHLQEQKFVL